MSTTTIEFEEKFLYKDERLINSTLKQYDDWIRYLENGLMAAESLFREPLTHDEKITILENGWQGVEELLRSKSNFPNANIDTLLELEGKNAGAAKGALIHMSARYNTMDVELKGDKLVLDNETRKKLEEERSYYTKSVKQNMALEFATSISEQVEKAIESGIMTTNNRSLIVNAFHNLLKIDINKKSGKSELMPHGGGIRHIN